MKQKTNTVVKALCALAVLCCSMQLQAQNAIRHYGSSSFSGIAPTSNKSIDFIQGMPWGRGYLLCDRVLPGDINGNNNNGPFMTIPRFQLLATDENQIPQWLNTYAEPNEMFSVSSGACSSLSIAFEVADAKQTSDGGFIACGYAFKNGDISNCAQIPDFNAAILVKFDVNGVPVWYRKYADGMNLRLQSVIEDPANPNPAYRYITCGYMGSNAFYMITDVNGVPTVARRHSQTSLYNEVAICNVAGTRYYTLTGQMQDQPLGSKLLLTTLNQTGVEIINKKYDLGDLKIFHGQAIHDAYDGRVIITGHAVLATLQTPDVFIMKVNPLNGVFGWANRYLQGETNAFVGNSIVCNPISRNIGVTGFRYIRESSGILTTTGAMYLETNSAGLLSRHVVYSGSNAFEGKGITYNSGANYFAHSGNTVNNNTYAIRNNYNLDCDPNRPITILAMNPVMSNLSTVAVSIPNISTKLSAYNLYTSNTLACGQLKPTGTNEAGKLQKFEMAPNPSTGTLTLEFSDLDLYKKGSVKVTDLLGRTIHQVAIEGNPQQGKMQINLPDEVVTGQYLVSMYCDDQLVNVQRLVVSR